MDHNKDHTQYQDSRLAWKEISELRLALASIADAARAQQLDGMTRLGWIRKKVFETLVKKDW